VVLVATCLGGLQAGVSVAQESGVIELSVPRSPGRDDLVELQIATGPLPNGARLIVMTEQGQVLGAVTPFVLPGTAAGATATIPVPHTALADRRLRLRLQVVQPGAAARVPRADEVRRVDIILVPAKD